MRQKKYVQVATGIKQSYRDELGANLFQLARKLLQKECLGTMRLRNLLLFCYCGSYSCPHHHMRGHMGALKVNMQLDKALGVVNREHLKRFYTEKELFTALNETCTEEDVEGNLFY